MSKTTVASIDMNGIYQGTQEIDLADLTDAHLHLPNGCDLEPGKYRWDAANKTFVALDDGAEAETAPDPHALRAVALGFICAHDQGLTLARETLDWLDFYTGSIDFAGALDDDTLAMVKRFRARKGD